MIDEKVRLKREPNEQKVWIMGWGPIEIIIEKKAGNQLEMGQIRFAMVEFQDHCDLFIKHPECRQFLKLFNLHARAKVNRLTYRLLIYSLIHTQHEQIIKKDEQIYRHRNGHNVINGLGHTSHSFIPIYGHNNSRQLNSRCSSRDSRIFVYIISCQKHEQVDSIAISWIFE